MPFLLNKDAALQPKIPDQYYRATHRLIEARPDWAQQMVLDHLVEGNSKEDLAAMILERMTAEEKIEVIAYEIMLEDVYEYQEQG